MNNRYYSFYTLCKNEIPYKLSQIGVLMMTFLTCERYLIDISALSNFFIDPGQKELRIKILVELLCVDGFGL